MSNEPARQENSFHFFLVNRQISQPNLSVRNQNVWKGQNETRELLEIGKRGGSKVERYMHRY